MHENVPLIERIRIRAHEISQRPDAGTPEENWVRAEAEVVAQEAARQAAIEAAEEEESIILDVVYRNAFTHP